MSAPARRAALLLASLLLLAVILSGCGGARTLALARGELTLRLEEYRILPQSVSVPPGPLRMTARNAGVLTHNVAVEMRSGDSRATGVVLRSIPTLLPGARSAPVTVTLQPGRYTLASTISNQADLGMTATLIVRSH